MCSVTALDSAAAKKVCSLQTEQPPGPRYSSSSAHAGRSRRQSLLESGIARRARIIGGLQLGDNIRVPFVLKRLLVALRL